MNRETNIRLSIAYDGTGYSGWQRQTNGRTIQGMLEEKLATITGRKTSLIGAGRTDAGVHARAMVANFHTCSGMGGPEFMRALNSMLPTDIRIFDAREAHPSFHARFDARGKTYRYDFFTGPVQPPHERLYRTHLRPPFSRDRVLPCLAMLRGSHDFSSFEAAGSRDPAKPGRRGAVRTLFRVECTLSPRCPENFSFIFQGDGFLRHMVRNLCGTLFLVGAGRMSADRFQEVLKARDRSLAGPTAPACGLFLDRVHYSPLPDRPDH